MNWLLSVLVLLGHFINGDDVWVTLPDESVIAFYHDDNGFDFIGTYLAYVDPQSGKIRTETGRGGCDMSIAWDKESVWVQWNPKVLGQDEDGGFIMEQPDCWMFTLWSFK